MATRRTTSAKRKARAAARRTTAASKKKVPKPAPSAPARAGRSRSSKAAAKPSKTSRARAAVGSEPVACYGLRSLRERIESAGRARKPATTARRRDALIKALEDLEAAYARLQGHG